MTLPELAIRRPVAAIMVLVSIIALGLVAMNRLPLGFVPEAERPILFVNVPYPGASPSQSERLIVRPLEEALGTVSGLQEMRAWCNGDGGRVMLEFDWGHDLKLARVEVRDKLDRVRNELPDDVREILVSTNWDSREADQPILEARLSSKLDLSESYDLLDRKIVRPLERIPGVATVRLDGVNPQEVRIDLRVADVQAFGMDIREVIGAIQRNNADVSIGEVVEGERLYTIRSTGTLRSVREIRELPIRDDGIRLSDVAEVTFEEPPLEYGRHLDGEFAVGITISKESSANTVEICNEVERRVARMNADPELQGVNFLIWDNQGAEIEKTLGDLLFTGIFGAILASVVLFSFLRRFSTTAVAVVCIPFSLIVACGVIWAQGRTMNTITLLGLIVGIGMLVDNAVVVMENIFRHQERGESRKRAAILGAREVSVAVVAATLTSVIVFLPLIFNKPTEMNIYLKELGLTVCITLLASLFISQTLIPLASAHLIKGRKPVKSRLMGRMEAGYRKVLGFNLRHRWLAPVIGLGVLGSVYFPYKHIEFNMDTSETEVFVTVRYDFSEPLNLEGKERVVTEVENVLDPHRDDLFAKAIYSFWSERWAMTRIYIEDGHTHEKDLNVVRERVRELLPEYPGINVHVADNRPFWRHDRGKRIAFQLTGDDSEVLAELAEEAKARLEEIPGLIEPFSSSESGGHELHVEVDRERAVRYGIPFQQPAEVIQLTYRGRNLPRFRTPDGEREMRLILDESESQSIDQLKNLPLWNDAGERIPLASVADTKILKGPEHIMRENRQTSIWVGARYEDGKREDYIPLVSASMNGMSFPDGYGWSLHETEQRRREQASEFMTNLGLALLLIFAVMASLFESTRQSVGLMVALPFAVSGAAWTLWAAGADFDQPAAVGLLLLIGIVVNNGIVMIEHINMYRRRGMERTEAMLLGGSERLRPILMTALTTLIGLLPIVIEQPALAGVYYYTMALVIMGGLLVSTFLTAILLPTTISLAEDIPVAIGRGLKWLVRMPFRRRGTARA
jgi:HAE1 family hydrophobic/amphiphilic exporter-1